MKSITYQQCRLVKDNLTMVSWIPSKYAEVGKILRLRNKDKVWEDGWKVVGAGKIELDESVVRDRENDYKRARKASDI